ncbi:MAG: type I DNA topoisomerase [bacterium]|nr:type I DNA topoisomerase [bacterium]
MSNTSPTIIIVESPTKVKSLEKYLGSGYKTYASVGHIRDLPSTGLGVDLKNLFTPDYQVIPGKEKIVNELRKATNGKNVLLATDPDREGEAIAWHIAELIQDKALSLARVEFEEITKSAILNAIKHPREIDLNRVDAQQARRVLDRLVGYLVSPLLWKTIKTGISAGRVQSVALRLVCEREEEILAFIPEEYWNVEAIFAVGTGEVKTKLVTWDGEKAERLPAVTAPLVVEYCEGHTGKVLKVETKSVKKTPPPPFTTSTLQQAASSKMGFGVRRTMTVAQQLYEGVELPGEGPVGLITYMRTDSVRLASEAVSALRTQIQNSYGKEYVPEHPRQYKTKSDAQDAHEAVRPTDPSRHPNDVREHLTNEQAKLYDIIWRRTMASQMEAARFERQSADIAVRDRAVFRANGQRLLFDGFLKLYGRDDEEEEGGLLPDGLLEKAILPLLQIIPSQHFTEPPARFSEATLVKELDELGIGRPSTYASIVQTLLDREYALRYEKKLQPTPLGRVVNRLLVGEFPDLFDVEYTAKMESELDEIAEGKGEWQNVIGELYRPLEKKLASAQTPEHLKTLRDAAFLPSTEVCPNGHPAMQLRIGRFGAYLRCSECSATKNLSSIANGAAAAEVPEELLSEPCEKCGSKMVARQGKFGAFLGCSNYPKCDNIRRLPSNVTVGTTDEKKKRTIDVTPEDVGITGCPVCGLPMAARLGRFGPFFSCSTYPKCNGIVNIRKDKTGAYKAVTPRPKEPGSEKSTHKKTGTTKKSTVKPTAKTPAKPAVKPAVKKAVKATAKPATKAKSSSKPATKQATSLKRAAKRSS